MPDKYMSMMFTSFIADSFALGAHWIYDTDTIAEKFGTIDRLLPPEPGSYHDNKKIGDLTHYGDQTLLLLQSLAADSCYDSNNHAKKWQAYMSNYTGYFDHASKETMKNLSTGNEDCGSSSSELGGAARIAPLLYQYRSDFEQLISMVQQQTMLTHNSATAVAAAQFLCSVVWGVLHGSTPLAAIEQAVEHGIADMTLAMRIRHVLELGDVDTVEVIKDVGQGCNAISALPAVVHLVTVYESDVRQALIKNVMAGGDSAARGLAVGMVLGAYVGMDQIPTNWLEGLNCHDQITKLLDIISQQLH